MKSKNYSLILCVVLLALNLGAVLRPALEEFMQRDSVYIFTITGAGAFNDAQVDELAKLDGIQAFYPVLTYPVTLKLKNYTLNTTVRGVDLATYPLFCKDDGTIGVHYGNEPMLLIGDKLWEEFQDGYGHKPLSDQIDSWRENYKTMTIDMQGEDTAVRQQAGIGAFVAGEDTAVYMDAKQLTTWLSAAGKSVTAQEGCVQIQGLREARNAAKLLAEQGLEVGAQRKLVD